MTKHEKRVLYLLQKNGGQARLQVISQAMHRVPAAIREQSLANLEALELTSSAKTPPATGSRAGGPGATVFWLTDAGKAAVADMIERGELKDPSKEPRAGKVRL